MKLRNKAIFWAAKIGAICAVLAASLTIASRCMLYFYEPEKPMDLAERIRAIKQDP